MKIKIVLCKLFGNTQNNTKSKKKWITKKSNKKKIMLVYFVVFRCMHVSHKMHKNDCANNVSRNIKLEILLILYKSIAGYFGDQSPYAVNRDTEHASTNNMLGSEIGRNIILKPNVFYDQC